MAPQPKLLFVLTSHDKMGDTGKPTGWYLPEFAHPYAVLSPHFSITIASPKGGHSPLDPSSVEATKEDKISVDFLKEKESLWTKTEKLESFLGKAGEFQGVFFVGGHGPMFDLASSKTSHALLAEFYASSKLISAVCHGPAALASVKLPSGEFLISGQPVTGFSNSEEDAVGLTSAMPFKLQDRLDESSGGKYEKAKEDWGAHVVVGNGGLLVTGQNPASAGPVGEKIRDLLLGN